MMKLKKSLAAWLALALAGGAGSQLKAAPFWDANTPGYISWEGDDGGPQVARAPQGKNGTLFAVTSSGQAYADSAVQWTPCVGWQTIGSMGSASCTCIQGNYFYVAGSFTSVTDPNNVSIPAVNVARYDIVHGTWSAVGDNTMTSIPQAITVDDNGNVYVGLVGSGAINGNLDTELFKVWNGTSWSTVGGGLLGPTAVRYYHGVTALATDGQNVYVGGNFDGGSAYNGNPAVGSRTLIKWTGSEWVAMTSNDPFGYDTNTSVSPHIFSIALLGGSVFVAGEFSGPETMQNGYPNWTSPVGLAQFSTDGSYVAGYSLNISNPYGIPPDPGIGYALAVLKGTVYVAGQFDTVGTTTAHGIAQWNDSQWLPVGSGLDADQNGDYGTGEQLAAVNNYLFVGGLFNYAGGMLANNGSAVRWVVTPEREPCEILDINLGPSSTNKVGFAATGLTDNDYWNPYVFPNQYSATVTNLLWSDDNVSGVNMTVQNAPGQWVNTTGDPMYDSFIYPWNGGSVVVTLNNLPAGGYDLYCYGHSQLHQDNTVFTASTPTFTSDTESTQDSTTAATSTNWLERVQYVVLRGVPVQAGQALTITAGKGDGVAILNGLQIVPTQERLLDLNFGPYGTPKVGFAASGLTTNDYWNPYVFPNQYSVTITNLLWSDQTASGVNMIVQNAPGQWGNNTGDAMYDGFIYPWNGGSVVVTLTNLPAGNYTFYCYGHSQLHEDNTIFQITSGSYTSSTLATQDSQTAATSAKWVEGVQYVAFRNVPVSGGQPVTINAGKGDGVAILNGIQILQIAPP